MIFNVLIFFSALAHIANRATGGVLAWNFSNVSSPDAIGTPSNVTRPTLPINGSLGGILFCRDWNWENCTYTVQPLNTCIVMNELWNDTISSIGPDNGTVIIAFTDTNCQGNETALVYPGTSNLSRIGWNDEISSIKALVI